MVIPETWNDLEVVERRQMEVEKLQSLIRTCTLKRRSGRLMRNPATLLCLFWGTVRE